MFKKILVYSEGAVFEDKDILRLAGKIVESSGGEILALHVIAQPPKDRFSPTVRLGERSVPAKAIEAAQEKARIYLKGLLSEGCPQKVKCRVSVVKGVIAKTVADIAKKEKVNLILMTVHDRDALGRLPEKSGPGAIIPRSFGEEGELRKRTDEVAEEIIKYAECPVLLVPV